MINTWVQKCNCLLFTINCLQAKVGRFLCQNTTQGLFVVVMWIQCGLFVVYSSLSFGCLLWSWSKKSSGFQKIVRDMKTGLKEQNRFFQDDNPMEKRSDLTFLFEMLAHNCGLKQALRVYSYSDVAFARACKPQVTSSDLEATETGLSVNFSSALIESHFEANRNYNGKCAYEVTVYPAETLEASKIVKVPRKGRRRRSKDAERAQDEDLKLMNRRSVFFEGLKGGETEYVVTIAFTINKYETWAVRFMNAKNVFSGLVWKALKSLHTSDHFRL